MFDRVMVVTCFNVEPVFFATKLQIENKKMKQNFWSLKCQVSTLILRTYNYHLIINYFKLILVNIVLTDILHKISQL